MIGQAMIGQEKTREECEEKRRGYEMRVQENSKAIRKRKE